MRPAETSFLVTGTLPRWTDTALPPLTKRGMPSPSQALSESKSQTRNGHSEYGYPNFGKTVAIPAIIPRNFDSRLSDRRTAGCIIALLPYRLPTFSGRGLITRDTGEWLPMAEKGEDVNRYCVRERNMGGLEEVGKCEVSSKGNPEGAYHPT